MATKPNNGVWIGTVDLLVGAVPRRRGPVRVVTDLALSIVLKGDVVAKDYVLVVRSIASGQTVASRRFPSRRRANEARTRLVATAEAAGDLTTFDWKRHLQEA